MTVTQTELAALLQALGVDTAAEWTPEQMEARLNAPGGVARFMPEAAPPLPEPQAALYAALAAYQGVGRVRPVAVAASPSPATAVVVRRPKGRRPAKRPLRGAEAGRPENPPGFQQWTQVQKERYWKEHPRPAPEKGIAAVVIAELRRAGAGPAPRFVGKAELLKMVAALCPDRDPLKLEGNLHNLVPTRLRNVYGLAVEVGKAPDGRRGYRIRAAAPAEPAPACRLDPHTPRPEDPPPCASAAGPCSRRWRASSPAVRPRTS